MDVKLLVVGHGGHGKDTVCEILQDTYGLSFISSSWYCAEKVIWPKLIELHGGKDNVPYESPRECYFDRRRNREFWYKAIREYNGDDRSHLAKQIFAKYDVYCGMRDIEEFTAAKENKLFDYCIWVDRSHHLYPESSKSFTLTYSHADYLLDNNHTIHVLKQRIEDMVNFMIADQRRVRCNLT